MDSGLIALIVATGLAATGTDERVSDYLTKKRPVFGSAEVARDWSDWGVNATRSAQLITGAMTDTPVVTLAAQEVGSIVSRRFSSHAKQTSNRLRPDESDYRSFPSGHTGKASVYGNHAINNMERLGWDDYTWMVNATIGMTAYARVESGRHYATDVLVGYALGKWMSDLTNSVVSFNGEMITAEWRF